MTVALASLVVGFTGQKRSGKDTCANWLVEHHGFAKIELPAPLTEELCIIDPWCHVPDWRQHGLEEWMRFSRLVQLVGIDAAKDLSPDVRPYQQRYGTDIVRNRIDADRWVKLAWDTMTEMRTAGQRLFVLPNIRAANEHRLCDYLFRVKRPGHELSAGDHEIEQGIERLVHDVVIWNVGPLDELGPAVDDALRACGISVYA